MQHLGTKRLETERLILRPFVAEDAEAMYRNWACDPEVTKFLTWHHYKTVGTAHEILGIWTKQYEDKTFYQWAIELKELGEPVGTISVNHHDDRIELAQMGYCIGKAWWNRGIVTEALSAVIRFLFEEAGVQRVEALHDSRNPASGAVMRKCGMKYEGTLRRSQWCNQGIGDADWYAILKEECK